MPEFGEWESFYVIVGSGAAALIGLQFVVMTLIAARPPLRAADAGAAFSTPTIVHFSTVLMLSAILSAPWHTVTLIAALWGLMGFCGMAYSLFVARQMRRQTIYQPVVEDWCFHALLPLVAYTGLVVAAFAAAAHIHEALFGIAGAVLVLLFAGIHNAWDAVAFHVFTGMPSANER
jgi:hypothetical protein